MGEGCELPLTPPPHQRRDNGEISGVYTASQLLGKFPSCFESESSICNLFTFQVLTLISASLI